MKCPSCGYFNLPGLARCSSCGLSLQPGGPAQPAQWSEVLPPRARNRGAVQQLEHRLGRPYRQGRSSLRAAQERAAATRRHYQSEIVNMRFSLRDHLMILLGLVPGLAQVLMKRWLMASVFAAWMFFLLAGLRLSFYSDVFDWFLYALLLTVVASVWDTADAVTLPAVADRRFFQLFRLACLSVSLVSTLSFLSMSAFNSRYLSARIYAQNGGTTIRNNDYVLVQRISDVASLQRGDVVMARFQVDRVLGVPGDEIEGRNGQLLVNGAPVLKSRMPFYFEAPAPDFKEVVPADSIMMWQQMRVMSANIPVTIQPTLNCYVDDIQGRVIAIHAPAARRQWVK